MYHSIRKYIACLEKSLKIGPHHKWGNKEYELLGELIYKKTGIQISTYTLKRIFGKLPYKNGIISPQKATLNALARFLDYNDWHDFEQNSKKRGKKNIPLLLLLLLIPLILFFIFFSPFQNKSFKEDQLYFKPENKFFKVPDNIGFYYKISGIKDSLFVNFFTPRDCFYHLSKNDSMVYNLYHKPGVHDILITNKKGKEKLYHVIGTTNEPVAYIASNDYKQSSFQPKDVFWLPPDTLKNRGVDITDLYWTDMIWYYNYNISLDSVHFSVVVENNKETGGKPFYDVSIILTGSKGKIIVPLVEEKGNIFMTFQVGSFVEKGRYNQHINNFVTDMNTPHLVEINKKGNYIEIKKDNNIVYRSEEADLLGLLYHIKISGKGSLRIKDLLISSFDKQVIYQKF